MQICKFLKNKCAFTLAEVLVMLLLVGVLVSLGTQVVVQRQNNYKHLYIAAYKNLKDIAGEMVATSPTKKISYGYTETGTTVNFCQKMADIFSTEAGTTPCSNTYNNVTSLTTPDKPSIVLINGMRLYIPTAFVTPGTTNYFNEQVAYIAVDLNGEKGPNQIDSQSYTGKRTPDIVFFAITDGGVVMPMSPLADDPNHFLANVQLCTYENGCSTDLTKDLKYTYLPIREAISRAAEFPSPISGTKAYNNDTSTFFKKSYTVDTDCEKTNTTTFCRVLPILPFFSELDLAI
ncbi:MAG: hypothetical protein PHV37_06685 [Candidatus Gastranaerophilales bacterium]|nr:hypothetical protein [Candidatus Gastranaerophilales bacterium]